MSYEKVDVLAGLNTSPVWRDGLSTTRSYVIASVKNKADIYNCVCIRDVGNEVKIKFYPDLAFWNLDPQALCALGARSHRHRPGLYDRFFLPKTQLVAVMEVVSKVRGAITCPLSDLQDVINQGRGRQESVGVHPKGNGRELFVRGTQDVVRASVEEASV